MAETMEQGFLKLRWEQLCERMGVVPDATRTAWSSLAKMYENPNRYYHTLTHVRHCIERIDEHRKDEDDRLDIREWAQIEAALFLHDLVYDARSQQNEEDSAAIARVLFPRCSMIPDSILATKHNAMGIAAYGYLISTVLDIDLSSLGAEPKVFEQDCTNIRMEYLFVPDVPYLQNRYRVIRGFYDRAADDRLYFTSYWNSKLGDQAKSNLHRHAAELETTLISMGALPDGVAKLDVDPNGEISL